MQGGWQRGAAQVGAGWLVLALAVVAALAWWGTRDTPEQARAKQQRAERATAALAEDARPVLYRWRDAQGVLQLTDEPPQGRKFERIHTGSRRPRPKCVVIANSAHGMSLDPRFRGDAEQRPSRASPEAGTLATRGKMPAFRLQKPPDAPLAAPSRHDQGSPGRRGNRQPSGLMLARRHGAQARRGHLHRVAAGPARAPQDRKHRTRGDEPRLRDPATDARDPAAASCGKRPAAGEVRRAAAQDPRPQGGRILLRPDARRGHHRVRAHQAAATAGCRSISTRSRRSSATRSARASASCGRANS